MGKLMRIAAALEYDGRTFCGWQKQIAHPSVQEQVELALSRVANQPISTIACGRTDTGVHAYQQIIHFDSDAQRDNNAWLLGSNTFLAKKTHDVSFCWFKPVSDDFHARFSAEWRQYRYVVYNSRARSALLNRRATWWTYPLDAEKMRDAAQCFVGRHDFTSFRSSVCQANSPLRQIEFTQIERRGQFIIFNIKANAFLHHMVRNLMGVLLRIGEGRKPVSWAQEVLEARDRKVGAATAPPDGLYLCAAGYPERFGLPAAPEPWFP